MKVLFLDHDGVICLVNNWGSRFQNNNLFDDFDDEAIQLLNEIITETDCEIVVSSDWRLYTDLEGLKKLYRESGIIKEPLSMTSTYPYNSYSLPENDRAADVVGWVDDNMKDISTWVAVDDLQLSHYIQDNFVWISRPDLGLKQTGIKEEIIRILNNESNTGI